MATIAERTPAPVVLDPGDGNPIWFLTNRMLIKATAASTGGAYGLFEALIAPGSSPPLHIHHREDEAFWILEGVFTMQYGDVTITARPGSYVFLPRGVPHTFVLEGDEPGRILTMLTPGGGEGFFVDGGRPAEHDGLPPAAPPDLARLGALAASYGMEFVGPPLRPAGVRTA